MTIDIIDLSDPAYADLSVIQMAMVREAQAQKDLIAAKAEKRVRALLMKLLGNNNARSSVLSKGEAAIRAEAEAEISALCEDLIYRLNFEALSSSGNENGPYRYPENPNYNLTPSQRFLAVRQYYMEISDPAARLEAYRGDTLARSYLGDFYATLYDLLASYVS